MDRINRKIALKLGYAVTRNKKGFGWVSPDNRQVGYQKFGTKESALEDSPYPAWSRVPGEALRLAQGQDFTLCHFQDDDKWYWQATFTINGDEYVVTSIDPALAICQAWINGNT